MFGVHSGDVYSGGSEKSIEFGAYHKPSVHSGAVRSGGGGGGGGGGVSVPLCNT